MQILSSPTYCSSLLTVAISYFFFFSLPVLNKKACGDGSGGGKDKKEEWLNTIHFWGQNEILFCCISGLGKQSPIKIFSFFFFYLGLHRRSNYPLQDNFLTFFENNQISK